MEKHSKIKCGCCGRYYDDCRNGVSNDTLAQALYCNHDYVGAFALCHECNLVSYGTDCKNNRIE